METYIRHWDNALSEEECDKIIAKFESLKEVSYMSGNLAIGSEQYDGAHNRRDFSLFFEQLARKEAKVVQDCVGAKMQEYKQEFVGLETISGGLISYVCKVQKTPPKGRLVIWPAGFTHPHRGNAVYDKDKYIATGWFEFYESPFAREV